MTPHDNSHRAIIVDLDGTIANCDHRVHHAKRRDWDAFFADLADDPPYEGMVEMLKELGARWSIYIITGRSSKYRQQTRLWLTQHRVSHDGLAMREEGDKRPSGQVKVALARGLGLGPEQVLCVFDDRDKDVSSWREAGYVCYQVKPGEY